MDYVKNFQKAIDYIEDNIKEGIDYREVAKGCTYLNFIFKNSSSCLRVILSAIIYAEEN